MFWRCTGSFVTATLCLTLDQHHKFIVFKTDRDCFHGSPSSTVELFTGPALNNALYIGWLEEAWSFVPLLENRQQDSHNKAKIVQSRSSGWFKSQPLPSNIVHLLSKLNKSLLLFKYGRQLMVSHWSGKKLSLSNVSYKTFLKTVDWTAQVCWSGSWVFCIEKYCLISVLRDWSVEKGFISYNSKSFFRASLTQRKRFARTFAQQRIPVSRRTL